MTAQEPAARVLTPKVTVCAYPECREPIPNARAGQRFCRAPAKCRQLDHRRRLREHSHQCQCGEMHTPPKPRLRPHLPRTPRRKIIDLLRDISDDPGVLAAMQHSERDRLAKVLQWESEYRRAELLVAVIRETERKP